jgi:hypothetical protein
MHISQALGIPVRDRAVGRNLQFFFLTDDFFWRLDFLV